MSGTTISEHNGRRGVWAQGDCAFFEVDDAADACVEYRRAMTRAEIGIDTHPPCVDALRVRELLAEVGRLREALAALVGVDPREASEVDGSLSCHYCGEWYSGLEPRHDADCPWVAARGLVGG